MENNLNKENEPGSGLMATLKRPAAGGPASSGPAQKKAAAKPKQPKKAQKPKLQDGLVWEMPSGERPWMKRCVDRWNLCAPFDPAVTEDQWKAYHAGRLALEISYFDSHGVSDRMDLDADDGGNRVQEHFEDRTHHMPAIGLTWDKSFGPMPKCKGVARECYSDEPDDEIDGLVEQARSEVERVLSGCPKLNDIMPGAADLTAKAVYILSYWCNTEDVDTPRTVETSVRIYSPCATARAVDVAYRWHLRARYSFAEHFTTLHAGLRTPALWEGLHTQQCLAEIKNAKQHIVEMDEQDCGYQKRKFVGKPALGKVANHLLGFSSKVLGDRKAFSLLMGAVGKGYFNERLNWADRVARRKYKLQAGEESDNGSDGDSDSGNEEMKPPPGRRRGGFDDDEDGEGCVIC